VLFGVATAMANRLIRRTQRLGYWKGMRVFVLDATTFSMPETFAELPATICVREVVYVSERSGYRSRGVCLHTTLLDTEVYDARSLADVYLRHWQIEVEFRNLKQTMNAAVLKGQNPWSASQIPYHLI